MVQTIDDTSTYAGIDIAIFVLKGQSSYVWGLEQGKYESTPYIRVSDKLWQVNRILCHENNMDYGCDFSGLS